MYDYQVNCFGNKAKQQNQHKLQCIMTRLKLHYVNGQTQCLLFITLVVYLSIHGRFYHLFKQQSIHML